MLNFKNLQHVEKSRTYSFVDGDVTIKNVKKLAVSSRGNHRLETVLGGKYIIPTGWLALKIDADQWSL